MKKRNIALILMLFILPIVSRAQENVIEELEKIAVIDQKIMMPMRDGIRLATDIYRPKTNEKVPIIFSRTPYNFNSWGDGKQKTRTAKRALEAVKRGYAYVVQNERGRYFSEGEWDILGVPLTDGYDAFSWMKNQTWSNGKIGTVGCSSTAEWQMAVAALDHPSHAAMVPQGAMPAKSLLAARHPGGRLLIWEIHEAIAPQDARQMPEVPFVTRPGALWTSVPRFGIRDVGVARCAPPRRRAALRCSVTRLCLERLLLSYLKGGQRRPPWAVPPAPGSKQTHQSNAKGHKANQSNAEQTAKRSNTNYNESRARSGIFSVRAID